MVCNLNTTSWLTQLHPPLQHTRRHSDHSPRPPYFYLCTVVIANSASCKNRIEMPSTHFGAQRTANTAELSASQKPGIRTLQRAWRSVLTPWHDPQCLISVWNTEHELLFNQMNIWQFVWALFFIEAIHWEAAMSKEQQLTPVSWGPGKHTGAS